MKNIIFILMLCFGVTTMLPSMGYAQENKEGVGFSVEDLANMTMDQRNKVLEAYKNKSKNSPPIQVSEEFFSDDNITKVERFVDIIFGGLERFCERAGVGLNKFIFTPVGILLTIVIIWYVGVGQALFTFFICLFVAFPFINIASFYIYRKFYGKSKYIVSSEGFFGAKTYEWKENYEWNSSEARMMLGLCLGSFFIISNLVVFLNMIN